MHNLTLNNAQSFGEFIRFISYTLNAINSSLFKSADLVTNKPKHEVRIVKLILTFPWLPNMFFKGYPLEAKNALKN